MAENLKDALVVVAASNDLGLFLDQGEEMKSLMDALVSIDVESLSDFRFAFVSDDKVDPSAVDEFSSGERAKFRDLITSLAEEVIPEGACAMEMDKPKVLAKRSCPTHVVNGRLVFRRLEDYNADEAKPSRPVLAKPFEPSAAAKRLRETAIRSQATLSKKLASGHSDIVDGHFGEKTGTLH